MIDFPRYRHSCFNNFVFFSYNINLAENSKFKILFDVIFEKFDIFKRCAQVSFNISYDTIKIYPWIDCTFVHFN